MVREDPAAAAAAAVGPPPSLIITILLSSSALRPSAPRDVAVACAPTAGCNTVLGFRRVGRTQPEKSESERSQPWRGRWRCAGSRHSFHRGRTFNHSAPGGTGELRHSGGFGVQAAVAVMVGGEIEKDPAAETGG